MRSTLAIAATAAVLSAALTLLATAAVCLHLGVLRFGGADPLAMALDADGAQLAVIYPVGDAEDANAMQAAALGRR